MANSSLVLENVTKLYSNNKGISDISFEIKEGEVFGFLGPNGAGKSTAIRTILGLIKLNEGEITILGKNFNDHKIEILSSIGYLTGDINWYENLTGIQTLKFISSIRGKYDEDYLNKLVGDFNIDLSQKIKKLSKGNRQKISLVMALLYKPKILIMDEPTQGFDPLIKEKFYQIIREVKKQGTTVFVSSHDLREVQKICDRAAFIREGKIIDIEEIKDSNSFNLTKFEVSFKGEVAKSQIEKIKSVSNVKKTNGGYIISVDADVNHLISFLSKNPVNKMSILETSLEDIFMHYYTDK
jgi:ABC-2 type transport system ATP-binding protein